MPIKDLQQQQAQVGRIRIGHQVPTRNGKRRPEKLDRFRFTTPSRALAGAVAAKFGGQAQPWQPEGRPAEFEVVSDARTLNVLVPPHPVSQWYEMWSGAGCVRRCDGEIEQISGEPCKCPFDPGTRGDLAAKGEACKATTRLKVMLPEIPGLGVWRLDSHGYYAAIELPQTAEFLGAVTAANGYIRATLAIEERHVRRPGIPPRSFYVPALHVDVTANELMGGAGVVAITGNGTPTPIGGPAPRELEAKPAAAQAVEPRADLTPQQQADVIRDAAYLAESVDALTFCAKQAADLGLMDLDVADDQGVMLRLGSLLLARREALTAQQEDPDELFAAIVDAASRMPADFNLDLEFASKVGCLIGEATPAQLKGYLDDLHAAVPA